MGLIKYCGIEGGNFGDDINLHLWSRLFPNLTDLTGQILFYGIGTLLDGRHDRNIKKVVLGTGIGEAHTALSDANWDFHWVRGPKTAAEFGLPQDRALGDPAILWPELGAANASDGPIGLIPHYATWNSFNWTSVACAAGMLAINPQQSPSQVIAQMRGCSRILAESLHGGICADAMGIPWAPCILAHRFNEFKWRDWLATVHRPYAPLMIPRPLVREISAPKSIANRLARWVQYQRQTRHPALRPIAAATAHDVRVVVHALRSMANNPAHFACSSALDVARQRAHMLERCKDFAKEYKLSFTPTY